MLQKIIFIAAGLLVLWAHAVNAAEVPAGESYNVDGKVFTSKAAAVRAVISAGKAVNVTHTRCEILTNKLTFKACPKNKLNNFESAQFKSLSEHE